MIQLKSKPESIAALDALVISVFDKYNIEHEHLPSVLISLTEAVNNAIIHGNRLDCSKKVQISHRFNKDVLIFTIEDEGKGFDEKCIKDPTKEENVSCCGGRGVFIMKELAHQITYRNNGRELELAFMVGACAQVG